MTISTENIKNADKVDDNIDERNKVIEELIERNDEEEYDKESV